LEIVLHSDLTQLTLHLTQTDTITDAQRWFLTGVFPAVHTHPIPERSLSDIQLTRDLAR